MTSVYGGRRCGLSSKFFDHLLIFYSTFFLTPMNVTSWTVPTPCDWSSGKLATNDSRMVASKPTSSATQLRRRAWTSSVRPQTVMNRSSIIIIPASTATDRTTRRRENDFLCPSAWTSAKGKWSDDCDGKIRQIKTTSCLENFKIKSVVLIKNGEFNDLGFSHRLIDTFSNPRFNSPSPFGPRRFMPNT